MFVDFVDVLRHLFGEFFDEVLDQQRNVFFALSQRRYLDREDIQSIEQVRTKCAGETFSIDEAWLSIQQPSPQTASPLTQTLQDQEKGMIEAALAESRGKVAGAKGAAARLGIPASTLESKIKQLKIDKQNF